VAELRSLNFEADVTKRGLFKTLVFASHVSDLRDQTVTEFLTTVVGGSRQALRCLRRFWCLHRG
jgi:hypothetical protein